MAARDAPRTSPVGYLVVLLGVAGWVVSCFLPLYRVPSLDEGSISFFRQLAFGSIGIRLGSLLSLFGAITVIGMISIAGMLRPRRWSGSILAGAVVAGTMSLIGALISLGSAFRLNPGSSLAVGYWCLWASVACVLAGTGIVLISRKRPQVIEGSATPLDAEH